MHSPGKKNLHNSARYLYSYHEPYITDNIHGYDIERHCNHIEILILHFKIQIAYHHFSAIFTSWCWLKYSLDHCFCDFL